MTKNQIDNKTTVPWGLTIGLGVFVFLLSGAGYAIRLLVEKDPWAVLSQAALVMSLFLFGVPALMCLGAYIMNKIQGTTIVMKNAWTLGWLLSCVGLLCIMGVYS